MPTYNFLGINIWVPGIEDLKSWVVNPIIDQARGLFNWVRDRIQDASSFVLEGVRSAGSWLWDRFQDLSRLQMEVLGAVGRTLQDSLGATGNAIMGGLSAAGQGIVGFVNAARDTVIAGLNEAGSRIFGALESVGRFFLDAFKVVGEAIVTAGKATWDFLTHVAVPAIQEGLKGLVNFIVDAVQAGVNQFMQMIAPRSPIRPNEAVGASLRALGGLVAFGSAFGIGTLAGELIHPLKQLGFTRFAAFMWDLADFKNAGGEIVRVWSQVGITEPLRWGLNLLYRPALPPLQLVDQMLFEGNIDQHEWRLQYALRGWTDEHIDAWFRTMFREPSQRLLLSMMEWPGLPGGYVVSTLKEIGLSEDHIGVILEFQRWRSSRDDVKEAAAQAFEKEQTERLAALQEAGVRVSSIGVISQEQGALRTQLFQDYVDGVLDDAALGMELRAIGLLEGEIFLIVAAARRARIRARRRLRIDALVEGYRKDLLDEDALFGELASLPMDREQAEEVVRREAVRKLPRAQRVT